MAEGEKYTLVDFNRAGIPLMELVTRPDLKSGKEIEKFAKELQLILRYLDASDADMEKGQMRIEVNISIKKKSAKELGIKVEIKNINSVKAASAATDFEIKRQTEKLEKGEKIIQETRGWDENKGTTFSQRTKEGSADYRYFPEPDLPPMKFSKNQIEELRLALPELPAARRERFKKEYGLNDAQIEIFTLAKHLGDYFEHVASELDNRGNKSKENYNKAANLLITELPPRLNMKGFEINELEGIKISPEAFAELAFMATQKLITSSVIGVILKEMVETGLHPDQIVKEKNLANRVWLFPNIVEQKKKILLGAADLLISPNKKTPGTMEGFGINVIEASACGRVVVASALEGLKDAIKDGENGFLVEQGNADAWAEKINELLSLGDEARKEFGEKARKYTIEHFSWDKIAKRYLEEIEK